MRIDEDIAQTLATTGIVRVADDPRRRDRVLRRARAGSLVRVLPGVYADPGSAADVAIRVAALAAVAPDAVVARIAAAALTYWPRAPVGDVEAYRSGHPRPQSGFAWLTGTIPPDLVVRRGGTALTTPALTVLDLIPTFGGDAIDRALRSGVALHDLEHALKLTGHRPGNRLRRSLLRDSRDEPWSAAERLAHRLLRAAGITGWRTNLAVTVAGRRQLLDVGWPALRVAVELDGWGFHGDRGSFEADRARDARLVAAGWLVLRFTYRQLTEEPGVVTDTIRATLRRRSGHEPRHFC